MISSQVDLIYTFGYSWCEFEYFRTLLLFHREEEGNTERISKQVGLGYYTRSALKMWQNKYAYLGNCENEWEYNIGIWRSVVELFDD